MTEAISNERTKELLEASPAPRVTEELGDIEFYLQQLRQALNITREETLQSNIDKLSVRYSGLQYSDAAAHARADKAGEQ